MLRQILRYGTRLVLTREPINLHQVSLIRNQKFDVNLRLLLHTKTKQCEMPQENKKENSDRKVLGKLEQKMKVMFTCKKCNYRNGKIISKLAYDKGVVIIRCDGCKNNHLIADNLGWFYELNKKNNIEKLMAAKGETVRKLRNDIDGYIEIVAKAEYDLIQHNKEREHLLKEKELSEQCKTGSKEEP